MLLPFFLKSKPLEPVPKLIDCALTRTARTSGSMDQALAVSQAFSLAKLRIF
jgi:hypothetical protein